MKVKGMALMSRRAMYAPRLGEAAWDAFVAEFAAREPAMPQPILATTMIPAEVFLRFNDRLISRFFGGRTDEYWKFGELTADFFSTQGPYVPMFARGDYRMFISLVPMFWKNLYTEGGARVEEQGKVLDVHIDTPIQHIYFEYTTLGFMRRGLEIKGASKVGMRRLSGPSIGKRDIRYQLLLP